MSRQTQLVRSTGKSSASGQAREPAREIAFSLSGTVTASTSPPWVRRYDGVLSEIVALLGTPGTGPTAIDIKKNDVIVHTITIQPGLVSQVDAGLNIFFTNTVDRLTDTVSVVGPGAADLTILHWFGAGN